MMNPAQQEFRDYRDSKYEAETSHPGERHTLKHGSLAFLVIGKYDNKEHETTDGAEPAKGSLLYHENQTSREDRPKESCRVNF